MPKKRKKRASSTTTTTTVTTKKTTTKPAKKGHKKRAKRKSTKKRAVHHHEYKEKTIEHKLLENMVSLQKVQTDLTEKFDHLGKELSKMLALFELAARNFAKNAPLGEYEKDKEFLEKMDKLLDQNKLLAKGLTLMEDHLRERMYGGGEKKSPEKKSVSTGDPFESAMGSSSNRRPLPHF
ncbi:MAG: hypothetical protein KC506_03065 [Nanoarchaeota archaeon]|nr:hypothetical protein [Nanoarchaeota archaeon]